MKTKLFFIFFFLAQFTFAQEPFIHEGKFLKFKINKNGVYVVDVAFLKNKLENFNIEKIRVLGTQGGTLTQKNNIQNNSVLETLPIKIVKDKIYFFANQATNTQFGKTGFIFEENPYEEFSYIYIGLSKQPSPIIKSNDVKISPQQELNYYFYYNRIEKDSKNLLLSGRLWLGDFFSSETIIPIDNSNAFNNEIIIKSKIVGQTSSNTRIDTWLNKEKGKGHQLLLTNYDPNDSYLRYERVANISETIDTFQVNTPNPQYKLAFQTAQKIPNGAYLDFVEYYFKKRLTDVSEQESLYFLGDSVAKKLIFNKNGNKNFLWQIEKNKVSEFNIDSTTIILPKKGDKWHLFNYDKAFLPEFFGEIEFNFDNKEVPELIIVYPTAFSKSANELKQVRKNEGLKVNAFDIENIYDAFSGGKTDPTSIRNMARYFWKKDSATFKYLCLLADASFDYKNLQKNSFVNIKNQIPTYESRESLEPIYSYSSDDYFGFLEDFEGDWPEGKSINNYWQNTNSEDHTLDISVGRIPVQTNEQASLIIKKWMSAENSRDYNNWSRTIGFVADNGDFNIHQNYVEEFSNYLFKNNTPLYQKKIFIDNYSSTETTNLGAKEALNTLINEGSLIINYNGHGSESGWAQEKILTLDQIQNWKNAGKLPLFFTATCQFGKFDNPNILSGAELALLNPIGGASALFTTTRPVYANSNKEINFAFLKTLTNSINNNKKIRIGDLFKITKNLSIVNESNRNFSLLGDPSMTLALNLENELIIDKINNSKQNEAIVKGLEKVNISGHSLKNFNGKVSYEIYDKPNLLKTLGIGTNSSKMTYKLNKNLLYKGVSTITNGNFNFEFFAPKDINYEIGEGSVFITALDENQKEIAINKNSKILVGGLNQNIDIDTVGPSIKAKFENGILNATIFDKSGLNFASYGLNHVTHLLIDDSYKIDLSQILKNEGDFKEFSFNFDLTNLIPTKPTVKLKTYDSYNNESQYSLEWDNNKNISIQLYPNPTKGNIDIELNLKNEVNTLQFNIEFYSENGQFLKQIIKTCKPCLNNAKIKLDLCDFFTNEGIYLYKIYETTSKEIKFNGKIIFAP